MTRRLTESIAVSLALACALMASDALAHAIGGSDAAFVKATALITHRRVAEGNGRVRRIAIAALARRLIIALWHYLEHGVIPEGAVVKG